MTKLRLIPKIGNVLPFRKNKSSTVHNLSSTKLQELAERDDCGRTNDAVGMPNLSVSKTVLKTWTEGEESDASKFDDAAYKEYEANFFRK
jgi:hypothetical protein